MLAQPRIEIGDEGIFVGLANDALLQFRRKLPEDRNRPTSGGICLRQPPERILCSEFTVHNRLLNNATDK